MTLTWGDPGAPAAMTLPPDDARRGRRYMSAPAGDDRGRPDPAAATTDDADRAGRGGVPLLRQVVLDAPDPRRLAEFYRRLLAYEYRSGDEPPGPGAPGAGDDPEWLVLRHPSGRPLLAFQRVDVLPVATWPRPDIPQQLHLDLTVATIEDLDVQDRRARALGARLLEDRSTDAEEPLRVYADPAGHPFCIFVAPDRDRPAPA